MAFGPSPPQVSLFNLVRLVHKDAVLEYALGRRRIDIAVPSKRLAIEYDGELFHADAERESAKDNEIAAMGWRVVHIRKADMYKLRRNPYLILYI